MSSRDDKGESNTEAVHMIDPPSCAAIQAAACLMAKKGHRVQMTGRITITWPRTISVRWRSAMGAQHACVRAGLRSPSVLILNARTMLSAVVSYSSPIHLVSTTFESTVPLRYSILFCSAVPS
jgi:hypothetical protein